MMRQDSSKPWPTSPAGLGPCTESKLFSAYYQYKRKPGAGSPDKNVQRALAAALQNMYAAGIQVVWRMAEDQYYLHELNLSTRTAKLPIFLSQLGSREEDSDAYLCSSQ